MEGYCVKCKHKCNMKDGKKVKMKNGRHRYAGKCEHCGSKMSVIAK